MDELDRSDSDDEDVGRRTGRRGGGGGRHSNENTEEEEEVCVECSFPGEIIKCEECSDSYHPLCLKPPLSRAPRGAWTCPDCKAAANKVKTSSHSKKKKAKVTSRRAIVSDDEEEDEDDDRSDADDTAEESRNGMESG